LGGVWGQWTSAGNGELLVNDGDVLKGGQSAEIYVAPGTGWRLFAHGRECDLGGLGTEADCPTNVEIADDNDVTGMIQDVYASAQASLGTHRSNGATRKVDPTSTCPDAHP